MTGVGGERLEFQGHAKEMGFQGTDGLSHRWQDSGQGTRGNSVQRLRGMCGWKRANMTGVCEWRCTCVFNDSTVQQWAHPGHAGMRPETWNPSHPLRRRERPKTAARTVFAPRHYGRSESPCSFPWRAVLQGSGTLRALQFTWWLGRGRKGVQAGALSVLPKSASRGLLIAHF